MKDLRKEGGWWVKIHGSPFQVSGIPDILGCYQGHFAAIEVKIPSKINTVSSRQEYIMAKIEEAGGYITVATSSEDALRLIYRMGVDDATKDSLRRTGKKGQET